MEIKQIIKYCFLVEAIIACFTCYSRADYNLPLFLFAYILWDQKDKLNDCMIHRFRMTLIFIFSAIIDLVWLIYWGAFWGNEEFKRSWDSGLHTFVIVMSSINLALKVVIIGLIFFTDNDTKNNLLPSGLAKNAKDMANVYSPTS